jgi:hypothetical protein
MNFYTKAFLIALVAYLGYVVAKPVILHYRTKYAGKPGLLAWRGFKTGSLLALIVFAVFTLVAAAPHYFWWILLAGFILIGASGHRDSHN